MTEIIESAEGYGKFKFELSGVGSRVVVIPEHITLVEVHRLIQALFGWGNCHLWEFHDSAGRKFKCKGGDDLKPIHNELLISPKDVCLSDVLPARGGKLHYTYDFGDDWRHIITRMAAPKSPGCYCVKTEGPDGVEDIGGAWGLHECKDNWHVPDTEEITARLERLDFHPGKAGTGLIEKESKALNDVIKSLSEYEWEWLRTLGEEGFASIRYNSKRLQELVRLLPGIRHLDMFSALRDGDTYDAEPEFRRYWRKMRDTWSRMRGAGASSLRTSQNLSKNRIPRGLQDKIYDFACAAACLYGVVSEEDLRNLIVKWRGNADWLDSDAKEIASCALQLVERRMFSCDAPAYFRNGMAVSCAKYPPADPDSDKAISRTLELRKGKERWDPDSYKKFLDSRYGDLEESDEYDELDRFIDKTWDVNPKDFSDATAKEDAIFSVLCALASGRDLQYAVNVMRTWFDMASLPSQEFSELARILANISNTTRHDANWGFTPNEMVAMHGYGDIMDLSATPFGFATNPNTPIIRGEVKIGRNDPCPCGSGKKYKKCCGRAV